MPTQRFEGPSLEDAVQAARRRLGPTARIVGATRVRRGGVGGFFAKEHVEVEAEVETGSGAAPAISPAAIGAPPTAGPPTAGPLTAVPLTTVPPTTVAPTAVPPGTVPTATVPPTAVSPGGRDRPAPVATEKRGRKGRFGLTGGRSGTGGQAAPDGDGEGGGGDPMAELIEEMAENGPSSILDLAERVNAEQGHFALAGEPAVPPWAGAGPSAVPGPTSARPRRPTPASAPAPPRAAKPSPAPVPVPVPAAKAAAAAAPASAAQIGPAPERAGFALMLERIARESGLVVPDGTLDAEAAGDVLPAPAPVAHTNAVLSELRAAPSPVLDRQPEISGFGLALHSLGLPLPACQAVRPATTRQGLETELCRALELVLPSLPANPRAPTSVVAVVGPRDHVLAAARAVAADIGAPDEQIALATQRKVWRRQDRVIASAGAAAEERRSWRWRERPSVVAIEQTVRPDGSQWAGDILRALEPALCWGVAEAMHKPEDLAAWSRSLGGLDVLALVDLGATTTPAAALAASVPVGRLDGQNATAQVWANLLCSRLMG